MRPAPVLATPPCRPRRFRVFRPRAGQPYGPYRDFGNPDPVTQAHAVAAAAAVPRHGGNRFAPHPLTGDPSYSDEERDLLRAVAAWRNTATKPFPTHCDLLQIMKGMGYVRVPHGYRLVPIADADPIRSTRDEVPPRLRVVSPD